jgi:two-component system nitrate/nitrite response regulator NarL
MAVSTKVLVVDDEPHLRTFVRILLCTTFADIEVHEAGDETAALALYAETKPDLVLLDIHLIGCSGITVLERIRRLDPIAEVVMLTAVNVRHTIEEAQAKGAAGYILKDVDEEELTAAIIESVQTRFGGTNATLPAS